MCTMQEIREENWHYSVFVKDILGGIYASLKKLLLKNAKKCKCEGSGLGWPTLSGRKYLTENEASQKVF